MSGQEIDRPAVSAWRHFYHRENSKDDLVTSMLEFQRKFDWDFMKINPRASYHIEGWGAVMRPSTNPLVKPVTVSLPVKNSKDWRKIEPLDWRSGSLGEILAATKEIAERFGDDLFCLQTVFSPLSIAADLVDGDERFVQLLRESGDDLHFALEAITRTFSAFVGDLLGVGVSGIFFATTEWASRDLLTEEEYLEFGREYDLRILQAASAAVFNVIHVCNKNNMLPLFRDYAGEVLSWNPFQEGNLSIHQASQITDKIFLTGVDHIGTLQSGSPAQIHSQIDSSLRDVPLGRLMIGPGCAVKVSTPDENLTALRASVEGWKP